MDIVEKVKLISTKVELIKIRSDDYIYNNAAWPEMKTLVDESLEEISRLLIPAGLPQKDEK